jgi:hypothetical protein
MEDQLNDINLELGKILSNSQALQREAFLLGSNYQRLMFFSKLRQLIQEKDSENDETASNILGWAYEKLSE